MKILGPLNMKRAIAAFLTAEDQVAGVVRVAATDDDHDTRRC